MISQGKKEHTHYRQETLMHIDAKTIIKILSNIIYTYKNIIYHNQGNLSQKGNYGLISKNQCTIPY